MLRYLIYTLSMKAIFRLTYHAALQIIVSWLVVLVFFCPLRALAIDAQVVQRAKHYYQSGVFCSVANVSQLSFRDGLIVVTLDIERRWSETIVKQANIRDQWFAIHCPASMQLFWSEVSQRHDVVIEGRLPNHGTYALSCRKFEADRYRLRERRRSRVAERVASLWRRLGFTAKQVHTEP